VFRHFILTAGAANKLSTEVNNSLGYNHITHDLRFTGVKSVRTWLTTTEAVTMLNTGVNNSPGYSHNNRRSVGCKATSYTLPFARCQASLLA
jgi:hypothetical protein